MSDVKGFVEKLRKLGYNDRDSHSTGHQVYKNGTVTIAYINKKTFGTSILEFVGGDEADRKALSEVAKEYKLEVKTQPAKQ